MKAFGDEIFAWKLYHRKAKDKSASTNHATRHRIESMLYRALFSPGQKSNLVDRLKLPERVVRFTLEVLKQIFIFLKNVPGCPRLDKNVMWMEGRLVIERVGKRGNR